MSILMWIVNLLIKSFDKKTENVDNENAMHSKTSVIISGFFSTLLVQTEFISVFLKGATFSLSSITELE